jgi:hypothetical protein
MKRCRFCHTEKPTAAFYRDRNYKDGLSWKCKQCKDAYNRSPERREAARQRRAMWRKENAEVNRQQRTDYYARRGWVSRQYNHTHLEQGRAAVHRRNAKKRNQLGSVPRWIVKCLRVLQQDGCHYCGTDISGGWEIEHMTPLCRGGLHSWTNICLSCSPCNRRKSMKTAEEFLSQLLRK